MHNKVINLALVAQVAHGLKELREKMVFIGGAVISLYTDDPAADEIRPTKDIDMTINLANYAASANKVKKVICLSTDKAAYPINAMGISKALMEKVAIAASRNTEDTTVCLTRYGNVMASRGSVIPLFLKQI